MCMWVIAVNMNSCACECFLRKREKVILLLAIFNLTPQMYFAVILNFQCEFNVRMNTLM